MKINKLRHQLLFVFAILISLTLITSLGSLYLYKKRNLVTQNTRELDEIRVLSMKNFKLVEDYLTYESKNEYYFHTRRSKIKNELEKNQKCIASRLMILKNNLNSNGHSHHALLDSISERQNEYFNYFLKIEDVMFRKGFKDYGAEGQLRKYAHQLMYIKNLQLAINVLMLRRHEKDFIIRKEKEYYVKFNALCTVLISESKKILTKKTEYRIFCDQLKSYQHYFSEYYELQVKIGINENEGLLQYLDSDYKYLNNLFDREKASTLEIENEYHEKLKKYNTLLILLMLIVSITFSIIYSNRISKIAINIKKSMTNYVAGGFREKPSISRITKIAEFDMIAVNFLKMADEIDSYLKFFKAKVEERTYEIEEQKSEIQIQKQKIQDQNDLLTIQKALLSEKNQSMTDSIRYAENIQLVLLPPMKMYLENFDDSFVFYQPKDIVSGDFYWIEVVCPELKRIKPKLKLLVDDFNSGAFENELFDTMDQSSKTILFAVADCTGHGVPGAFMSIMGINHLNKIVREYNIYDPSDILQKLDEEIRISMRQDDTHVLTLSDGMDIGCCALDLDKMTLKYAGANTKLILIRENHIHEFKSGNKPIGMYPESFMRYESYNRVDIKLLKGDKIYLFSDGFQDQFGGERNKKFKTKNLKQLLLSINQFEMAQQYEIIKESFLQWKGENFQVDDITIIGISV